LVHVQTLFGIFITSTQPCTLTKQKHVTLFKDNLLQRSGNIVYLVQYVIVLNT